MYLDLALLAVGALLFSIVAGRVERSWLTGPIVFILFGFLIGPLGLELLSMEVKAGTLKFMAELTLALVLFIDAAGADLKVLRRESAIPTRMLLIGLPLTLLLGFGTGVMLFSEFFLIEVAILATLLAPTDAALGQEVVKNQSVPANLRQGLNAESGLNDGICVPILLVFLTLASGGGGHEAGEHVGVNYPALTLLAEELGIGLLVGLVLVTLTVYVLRYARAQDWLTPTWIQIPVVALSISCFATAQYIGGSGFIAAFCGGLLFGYLMEDEKKELLHSAEGTGDTFALITWVLFGAAVVGSSIGHLSWPIVIYTILSLTVIRMVPIFLSLLGSGVSTEGKWFLGWFGPRGLASIVFAVIVINADLPQGETITTVVSLTVVLSIVLHGISAKPWASRWGKCV